MIETRKWYAVYTKPKWEKKVSELLNRRKIENFCPLNKVIRQWHDRKKIIMEPLFTSYVFVRLNDTDLLNAKTTDGVLNLVHWLSKPAIIRDEEIDTIKTFMSEYENIHLEKTKVSPNDTIRVIDGPLMSMEGNVLEVRNKSVKVLLPSLGFHIVAQINISSFEKVVGIHSSNIKRALQQVS